MKYLMTLLYSREDHEDEGQGEVQGAVLKVPLHPRGH